MQSLTADQAVALHTWFFHLHGGASAAAAREQKRELTGLWAAERERAELAEAVVHVPARPTPLPCGLCAWCELL